MLLASIAIGGTILAATSIAGLLTTYQIRQTTDLANSGKAIFAADAGLEYGLYLRYCAAIGRIPCPPPTAPAFANGSSVTVECFDSVTASVVACDSPAATQLRAEGTAGRAVRVFTIGL